ncbi:Fic family protein [Pseudomonas chlororaphis]|uniref:hypothetical protein n=1 Tax=Pseudomonas chlororaphis TaxID=587753 RepID=UPI001D123E02|nr:hypothetical protein [Pseudomonas chlororaphis]
MKSLVIRNSTPKGRSQEEIAGYRNARTLIHESAAHMPFTEGLVLQPHTLLHCYMPQAGEYWKVANNDIIERLSDGTLRLRFQPVAAHLTSMAIADLIRYCFTALDQHLADPLVPLAMLDFLCAGPFPDRNERMSRSGGGGQPAIFDFNEVYPSVSRDMVRSVLRAMKSEELIKSTGKGVGRSDFASIKWARDEY